MTRPHTGNPADSRAPGMRAQSQLAVLSAMIVGSGWQRHGFVPAWVLNPRATGRRTVCDVPFARDTQPRQPSAPTRQPRSLPMRSFSRDNRGDSLTMWSERTLCPSGLMGKAVSTGQRNTSANLAWEVFRHDGTTLSGYGHAARRTVASI